MTPTHRFCSVLALTLAGCSSSEGELFEPDPTPPGTTADAITWYRDVLPIAQSNCLGCHSENGIGPFSMETDPSNDLSYAELQSFAQLIKGAVERGDMPPWKPTDDCQSYRDTRSLSADEIAIFTQWADQGALRGDPADAPVALEPPGLERVDVEVYPEAAYLPSDAAGPDDHHCFVLDPALDAQQDVVGYQILPGSARVHHVLLYKADRATALALDAADPEVGYSCYGGPGPNDGVVGGWVPGMPPISYPAGTGLRMGQGDVLLMDIHYNFAGGEPLNDRTGVQLMFADSPVPNPATVMPVRDGSFVIPPRAESYETSTDFRAPSTGRIWGMAPHMHEFGIRTYSTVERADGSSECLIDIPEWDFNWQQFYFVDRSDGIPIAQGERVRLNCEWFNPTADEVRWGDGTADEMCITYFYVTAD